MLCIAKIASCRTLSPAAVQLRKLVAGGEIPDTGVCSASECPFRISLPGSAESAPGFFLYAFSEKIA